MKNVCIILILSVFMGCGGNSGENSSKLMKAPDFTLDDMNGESVSLNNYREKIGLLVF